MKLMCGDCLDLLQQVPDGSVDMVLCDLPYGTTQCTWDAVIPFDALWNQWYRVAKTTAAIVLFGAEPFSSKMRLSNLSDFKYDWIWDKVKGTGFLNAKKQPMRNHEIISVFYRKQCKYYPQMTHGHERKISFRAAELQTDVYGSMRNDNYYDSCDRYPRSIQVFSTDTQNSSEHPTQKPVALLEYLIRTYTDKGDTVLDNCMGSGSTGVAAVNTGRNFIGIEINEEYYSVAIRRITEARERAEWEQAQTRIDGW